MTTIKVSNTILDNFKLENQAFLFNFSQYQAKSGVQEYRLYSYLTTFFNDSVILDIGTYEGTSSIALSHNSTNFVKSYDVIDKLKNKDHIIFSKPNISYTIKNGVNVIEDLTDDELEKIKIIMIDTEHTGDEEIIMINKLNERKFSGIIILDDIHHPNPEFTQLMENLWKNIPFKKYDVTKYGHYSGTGIILLNTDIDFIFE